MPSAIGGFLKFSKSFIGFMIGAFCKLPKPSPFQSGRRVFPFHQSFGELPKKLRCLLFEPLEEAQLHWWIGRVFLRGSPRFPAVVAYQQCVTLSGFRARFFSRRSRTKLIWRSFISFNFPRVWWRTFLEL